MKRIAVSILALCALLLITGATAQKQKQKKWDPCDGEGGTQFEANQCAHKQFLAADAELNKAYSKLMAKLDDAEERAKLKDAELAWIKYRDANCEYEAFFYRGGTIRPAILSHCLARLTNERAAQLKQQLKFLEEL